MNELLTIHALEPSDHEAFFDYLNDHLTDNGQGGTPLFQPIPRSQSRYPDDKIASFIDALEVTLGQPGWRRAWIALDADGALVGHIDLRARPECGADHRALLGMGVRRDHRSRGLGHQLIDSAIDWAQSDTGIDWIDLEVLSANTGARHLYQRSGFTTTGEIEDMFRIDGTMLAYTFMTKNIRE